MGSGGRRPARLRLPQLGSKHRLSSSKENLDGAANSEGESLAEGDGEGGGAEHLGGGGGGEGVASESTCSTEASSSHCDVVLMNGDSGSNGPSSDCSVESSTEQEQPPLLLQQHRDDLCLDAIYNLYAISVRLTCTSGELAGRPS